MIATAALSFTLEGLLRLPDGDHYGLVDGQLSMRSPWWWPCYIAGQVLFHLWRHCGDERLGWVQGSGLTLQCFPHDRNRVRKADVSFFLRERVTDEVWNDPGHTKIRPDLTVHVLSGNDLLDDFYFYGRVDDFLVAGVPLVWVVQPEAMTVTVYQARGPSFVLQAEDELTGGDVLPGFRCRVADFFWQPTSPKSNSVT